MSRRARSRLLARELKRGETYLAPAPSDEDAGYEESDEISPVAHGYSCPCCNRQGAEHFWCGVCSTGAIESIA